MLLLAVVLLLCGCSQAPSKNSDDYVGAYVLHGPIESYPAFIVLRKDHAMLAVRFVQGTGEFETYVTSWHLNTNNDVRVGFENRSYPVGRNSGRIRLVLDDDTNEFYEKLYSEAN